MIKMWNNNSKEKHSKLRVLAVILVLAMTFSLAGCGDSGNDTSSKKRRTDKSSSFGGKLDDATEKSSEGDADYPRDGGDETALSTEEVTTEDKGDSAENQMGDIPFIYSLETSYYEKDDDGSLLYENTYDELKLQAGTEDQFPGIKKALADYTSKASSLGEDMNESDLIADAKEQKAASEYFTYYTDESKAYIQRVDEKVLSILDSFSNYYGGAHGYYGLNGFNYNPETGEEISIEDVVSSMDDLRNAAAEVFSRDYADLIEAEPGCEDYLRDSFDDPKTLCWTLTPLQLELYYNPYSLASYAAGLQIIRIKFSDYPDLFNKGYGASDGDWAVLLPDGGISEDITGDGVQEKINVEYVYNTEDEYSYIESVDVQVGEDVQNINYYGLEAGDVYFVKRGDKYLLYIEAVAENDYRVIHMVDITNGEITDLDYCTGSFTSKDFESDYGEDYYIYTKGLFYNPNLFYLEIRQQYISTFDGVIPAQVGENGEIKLLQDYYELPTDFNITSKMDLEFDEVDAEGNVIGKTTIPKGTIYYMYRSDGETYVDCKTEDGTYVRIVVDHSDYPYLVNGINLEDAFDGIMFAG